MGTRLVEFVADGSEYAINGFSSETLQVLSIVHRWPKQKFRNKRIDTRVSKQIVAGNFDKQKYTKEHDQRESLNRKGETQQHSGTPIQTMD